MSRRSIGVLGFTIAALAAAAGASAGGNHGKVGATVTVKGQGKDTVAITVTKVEDPLLAYGADPGMREIGVVFSVRNVSKVKYSGTTSGLVSTADGEMSGSQITGGGPCDPPAILNLAPGQTKTVCVPFEVIKTGKLAFIQFITDSGYGTPAVFAAK
jgi:hypothetical protein